MSMRLLVALLSLLLLNSCQKKYELKTGVWRGLIELQGQTLPFNFELNKEGDRYTANLINATERLPLDEITLEGDSVKIVMHIFDIDLRAKVYDNTLEGFYYKNYDKAFKLPFHATWNERFRFEKADSSAAAEDYSGKYAVTFVGDQKDTTVSVGIFKQKGNVVTGTFLTPTGDYRYLAGNVVNGKLHLSTFDGNHAFLFVASKNGNTLQGDFWSGSASHEVWTATADSLAELPSAESLTYLKPGYDKITFQFPDVNRNMISPDDSKFKNKVIILQLFGTWCPNCMDETKFLSAWYDQNKDRGVEILGMAYERKDDFDYASGRVKKMKDKLGVNYDFVIGGTYEKDNASQTLPMLNRVMAFPTTIIIGKDGKVKHIRTGFEGPGTGIYHERFKQRFNEIVNELLAEKNPS